MLVDELKKANIAALKAHDSNARAIYSVVLNKIAQKEIELRFVNQVLVDADVYQIIQKTLKELQDEEAGYRQVANQVRVELIQQQAQLLVGYLPKMLTEEEVKTEISQLSDQSMPNVMRYFKENFAGRVDLGMVNRLLRNR
ncbi:MAG: GatB/YqeY domain-containing protein [Bacilli bacterium]|jgi:uncharacterized protein YqeY|nr:GatB/YqeY domain-containing protein [Bacilli bacterium]MDY0399953.1 GatB/YqeY domain-containing protein [Bacilli bacterium]